MLTPVNQTTYGRRIPASCGILLYLCIYGSGYLPLILVLTAYLLRQAGYVFQAQFRTQPRRCTTLYESSKFERIYLELLEHVDPSCPYCVLTSRER